ncbi:(2,3-dihydroxybenzoyl)adenylate synthase [Pseudonocardia sp. HH130630-07]|uniref:(2,3-dihydroxybenzoyl)adenylate synthase n=1 Tax=Pseudonocardia sp. HH130630-07 TaxID=1690815 RepID=UPI0008151EB1|nr:AMP-binding protein [Pseudonocardia sp. HH130630-07]ANY07727.1 2,3-dihydroxybenzoate-AMP ligase [Pseudonocardia sp. HH130630-07]
MSTDHTALAELDLTPWPGGLADRYRELGLWRGETYRQVLARLVDAYADRTAVVDDHRRLTYRELDALADRVARGLSDRGLGTADRVLVQLPNRSEFLVVWWALQKIGAVPVHTQPGHRRSEMTHLASLCGARAYVLPDVHAGFDHRVLADEVRAAVPSLELLVVLGDPGDRTGAVTVAELEATGHTEPAGAPASTAGPGDIAVLLLSGGTTGLPKLIPRTHDDYAYNGRRAAEVAGMAEGCVYLATLPVAFNYTMNCPGVLGALGQGGTVVMAGTPDPGYCFELIERERVTHAAINPQLTPLWLDEREFTSADLSSLQVLQIGSARLADDTARRVVAEFGARLQQVFGMAEGMLSLSRLDEDDRLRTTTQGCPISDADETRVVGPDDAEVPDGEEGELLTRGPYTLRGYYRAGAHNARSFTADGFYRTGDMVRRLPSGHLAVVGRAKDQINRAGEKIAATEVEGHLLAHPGVRSVALVAGPDQELGERSVAFVVAGDGHRPDRAALAAHLDGRGVAAYKVPDEVRLIESMPLTPLGKMDKKALTALLVG